MVGYGRYILGGGGYILFCSGFIMGGCVWCWFHFGYWWVVLGLFLVVVSGGVFIMGGCGGAGLFLSIGGWWWIYFELWWVLVGLFWVLVGGGGFILGGGRWWWVCVWWWLVVVSLFEWWWVVADGGMVYNNSFARDLKFDWSIQVTWKGRAIGKSDSF